jgi:hypothetical protein
MSCSYREFWIGLGLTPYHFDDSQKFGIAAILDLNNQSIKPAPSTLRTSIELSRPEQQPIHRIPSTDSSLLDQAALLLHHNLDLNLALLSHTS